MIPFDRNILPENFHCYTAWSELVKDFVSTTGFVDYNRFKKSEPKLNTFLELLSLNEPQSNWTENEKIAYWINAYNAFTVKLILENYGVTSIKDIKTEAQTSPWKIPFFKIGEAPFTLDKIENDVLRKQFNEPRIHFCIVCASFSCPKFRNEAFTPGKLELQLEDQTADFINDPDKNSLTQTPIGVSSLFQWYRDDFANQFYDESSLLNWMNQYSHTLLNIESPIEYLPYNCALNGA